MIKNITLSADETLIQQARRRANAENTTLNDLFRAWLEQYVAKPSVADQYLAIMQQMKHSQVDRQFNREEMNERR